jgi:hypothetical protein
VNNGPPPPSGHEVKEPTPEPRYTGKLWNKAILVKKGIKVFNGCMVRFHLERAKNGKKLNDLFMQRMKDKYEKKKTAASNKHGVQQG